VLADVHGVLVLAEADVLAADGIVVALDAVKAADRIVAESTYPGREAWMAEYLLSTYSDTEALEAFRPRAEG